MSTVQSRILDIIRDANVFGSGITDEGIIATYSRRARVKAWTMPSPSSIRSRRKELEDKRLVRPCADESGRLLFGLTERGNPSQLWTVAS
ncbi:hypothetical protein [Curtobacterium sp. USHLN213]|uniref:hypothetical protein n=1 Tax=Curtobacterium sp. USHLN213 TaxID=3081255 RepID=UPI003017F3DE